ncbi:MAG TPA: peptidase U32 family protein, partial [Bacteroidales bacterium]|nr:peptidase U32 family protein [Bacteroidales bacterium]
MTKDHKNIEIMAPVGSYEALQAAIQGGADSVYFGIEQLNMRSRSTKNFTTEDLKQIVAIAKEYSIKTYLTLNTIIYDTEIELMKTIVNTAKEAGITAIIASDIAAIQYAHSQGVEVHISTQANITNIEAVKFYARFADVMVTARELTIDQVAEITKQIRKQNITGPKGDLIQIEIFAHGALCMAVSGKCYMSLHAMNASANRGACLQVCRRSYTLTDNETDNQLEVDNKYIMSPKDLWT